jgi:hypothetical protein
MCKSMAALWVVCFWNGICRHTLAAAPRAY